jgi:hypothetical protein
MSKHPRVEALAYGWVINIITYAFSILSFWLILGPRLNTLLGLLARWGLFLIFLPFTLIAYPQSPDVLVQTIGLITDVLPSEKILGLSFLGVWWLVTLLTLVLIRKKYQQLSFFTYRWAKDLATSAFFSSLLTLTGFTIIIIFMIGKALSVR